MKSKMITTHNYQQLKQKTKTKIKQTTRRGTESQKWKSHGGLSVGKRRKENGGKGTGNNKQKW